MFFDNWFGGRRADNDGGNGNGGGEDEDDNDDDDDVVPQEDGEDQPQQPQQDVHGQQAGAGAAEANHHDNQDDDDDEEEEEEEGQRQGNAAAAGAAAGAGAAAAAGGGLLLISEDEWFRLNTLRDANSQQERYDDGTPNHNNLVQQRVNDERSYANRVIQDAFRQDEEEEDCGTKRTKSRSSSFGSTGSSSFSSTSVSSTSSSSSMMDEAERRQKQLKKWKKQMYQLQIETFEDYTTATAGDSGAKKSAAVAVTPPPLRFPLHAIALRSETVFAMAGSTFSTRFLMRCPTTTSTSTTTSSMNDDMAVDETGDEQQEQHQHQHQQEQEQKDMTKVNSNVLVLPLRDYPRTHAEVFFRLLLGEIDPDEIPDDAVIDCCRLAHYLQCDRNRSSSSRSSSSIEEVDDKDSSNDKPPTNMEIVRTRPPASWGQDDIPRMTLVEEIADVCLNPSVDSNNCMSLCQLAAQFELETLRDISLNHIVTSLSTLEGHEFWDELPVSLRTEIERMRTIMQTEQHLHGGKATKKKLFFNSCREYIALLEEQYEYHLERLEDANFEQQQKALEIGMCYRTHSSWLYAQFKIERHASKVRALKLFLDEQRRIFGSSSSSSR